MDRFKRRSDIDTERPMFRKSTRDPEYKDLEYFGTEVRNNRDITDEEKIKYRQILQIEFPNRSLQNLLNYNCLDQGPDGACMVACLFNLINLNNKNVHHGLDKRGKIKLWSKLKSARYWSKFYKNYVVNPQSVDFGEMLDIAQNDKLVKNLLNDPSFQYVPISSQGVREILVNKELIPGEKKGSSAIAGVRKFFEKLIDDGIMVGVSWNGHARVLIGYNDKEVLFADSWGNNYQQETFMPNLKISDFFKAGFSTVDKKSFYSNVRDCIFFVPPQSSETSDVALRDFLKF